MWWLAGVSVFPLQQLPICNTFSSATASHPPRCIWGVVHSSEWTVWRHLPAPLSRCRARTRPGQPRLTIPARHSASHTAFHLHGVPCSALILHRIAPANSPPPGLPSYRGQQQPHTLTTFHSTHSLHSAPTVQASDRCNLRPPLRDFLGCEYSMQRAGPFFRRAFPLPSTRAPPHHRPDPYREHLYQENPLRSTFAFLLCAGAHSRY